MTQNVICSFVNSGSIPTECRRLSTGGLLPDHDLLVVVADPRQPGSPQEGRPGPGVGSGGATINAVFVAVERLSAQLQHTTVSLDSFLSSYILVICCVGWLIESSLQGWPLQKLT